MAADRPPPPSSSELPSPPRADCVPGYALAERLGAGSYATVYRARRRTAAGGNCGGGDAAAPPVVAVKCIEARRCRSEASKDNLIREIGLLKRLRHRHIVALYDFRWDAQHIYLVLEYCAGGDLSAFIRQHRMLPEAVARKFLRQLASALFYLRGENIAHMDLKPQNLLLTDRYRPVLKVADFGFAQSLSPHELQSTFKGSPLYMAPEMFGRPVPRYDATVDLWSVGVILYECLYGRAPFASETYEQLVALITSRREIEMPPRSPPLSLHCLHLLTGLLQRDRRSRLTFDQFFAHRFVALLPPPPAAASWQLATADSGQSSLLSAQSSSAASFNYAQLADEARRAGETAERLDAAADGQAGDWQEVIDAYCSAVDRHLRALQCCDERAAAGELRRKASAYLRRAEALKAKRRRPATGVVERRNLNDYMASGSRSARDVRARYDDFDGVHTVLQLWRDTPQIAAAVTLAERGNELQRSGELGQARAKYELAIGACLQVISAGAVDNEKTAALKSLVRQWLCRAERIGDMLPAGTVAANEQLGVSTVREEHDDVMAAEDEMERMIAHGDNTDHPCCVM